MNLGTSDRKFIILRYGFFGKIPLLKILWKYLSKFFIIQGVIQIMKRRNQFKKKTKGCICYFDPSRINLTLRVLSRISSLILWPDNAVRNVNETFCMTRAVHNFFSKGHNFAKCIINWKYSLYILNNLFLYSEIFEFKCYHPIFF